MLRRINARVEPKVRAGFASPGLVPAGLIVLETVGRKSGQMHRTPLFASLAPGGNLWVSTVLGRRANWLRNAEANPDVRYWLQGKRLDGRAIVSAPGLPEPDVCALPRSLRGPARRAMGTARLLGLGTLIIVPVVGDSHG